MHKKLCLASATCNIGCRSVGIGVHIVAERIGGLAEKFILLFVPELRSGSFCSPHFRLHSLNIGPHDVDNFFLFGDHLFHLP